MARTISAAALWVCLLAMSLSLAFAQTMSTPADRVLQFASLNWDTCFEEILPTLTGGASLVIDNEAYTGSLPRFLRLLLLRGLLLFELLLLEFRGFLLLRELPPG